MPGPPPQARAARPASVSGPPGAAAVPPIGILLGFALHVPLALLVVRLPLVGTAHALASLGVGLAWALSSRPGRTAYAAVYICGSEVLWRMTGTTLYWEFAKYAVSLILLVAAWRIGRGRYGALPLVYFALLLPGALITIEKNPFGVALNDLSFNLSGPLAIAASVLFFFRVRFSLAQFRRLLLVGAAPIAGASAVVWQGLARSANLTFGGSNVTLSGGFAPNQVSSILGLGVLLIALALLSGRTGIPAGAVLIAILLLFATQSAMTFSRGGLYLAGASLAVAALSLARERDVRQRLVLGAAVVAAAAGFVIVPRLLSFTGGAIASRFAETSTTGRAEIVEADFDTWLNAPVFGVGPGGAKQNRGRYFRPEASHTEFTRLLAEHGLFGLAAAGCLAALAGGALRVPSSRMSWALRAALLTWGLLFMSIDGVRLVAPCLAFGIALATLDVGSRPARRDVRDREFPVDGPGAAGRAGPAPRLRPTPVAPEADGGPW
jgi:O-antigen ligase